MPNPTWAACADRLFFDEQQPAVLATGFESARRSFGDAVSLPAGAYCAKQFADLEDRFYWTKSWVAVGFQEQIPRAGDLLPYTIGTHGMHVQRSPDGQLIGRFNKAQHGGCRAIPLQCQTGNKTKCSYTSCGYSRDRPVILADELQESQRSAHQYLGVTPERLLPVSLGSWHSVVLAQMDPSIGIAVSAFTAGLPELTSYFARPLAVREDSWVEVAANWKLAAAALTAQAFADTHLTVNQESLTWNLMTGDAFDFVANASAASAGETCQVVWMFPNLVLYLHANHIIGVVVQPTGVKTSILRVCVLGDSSLGDGPSERLVRGWVDWIKRKSDRANDEQQWRDRSVAERPESEYRSSMIESSRAQLSFNKNLLQRLFSS